MKYSKYILTVITAFTISILPNLYSDVHARSLSATQKTVSKLAITKIQKISPKVAVNPPSIAIPTVAPTPGVVNVLNGLNATNNRFANDVRLSGLDNSAYGLASLSPAAGGEERFCNEVNYTKPSGESICE